MISEFVREQKRYTQKDLCGILKCPEDKAVSLIRKLKEFGVLKVVTASDFQRDMSDLQDEDIEVADVEAGENEYFYVFTFVGIIVVAGRVLKCYPKYLINADQPKDELRQVLKVLEKYNSKEQIVRMFNGSSESSAFNLLAVLLFLLKDYFENGVYSNTEDILESNGSGEILWDKTINETFTFLYNNRPYYIDVQTKKRVTDDYNYFKLLHECILTRASEELKNAGLLDLFEITGVDLSDEELDDFGEVEYIRYRIEKELDMQFNTRKQLLLKTMYSYILHSGSLYDLDCLSLFGTNSFNIVWERVCSSILDNQLSIQLGMLDLPITLRSDYDKKKTLLDVIEKPFWTATGHTAMDTLIPDVVSFSRNGNEVDFIISDAKYYNIVLEANRFPKSQPGIESVTKQYLYQLAYKKFIEDHKFNHVKNCFLFPTEENNVIVKGDAVLHMLEDLDLQNIKVRLLPARVVYDYYLSGRKLDISCLKLDK